MWTKLFFKWCKQYPFSNVRLTQNSSRTNCYSFLIVIYCFLLLYMNFSVIDAIRNKESTSNPSSKNGNKQEKEYRPGCVMMDGICIEIHEVASYEAIKSMHTHLDDDHSGDIDLTESVDFLREELNYTKGYEKRQKAFHHNDQHISVQELWEIWLSNEVHNWTVEQTVGWLYVSVELGQYADVFYENAINGSVLPRLAMNSEHYLTRILDIKNPTHRSKISIKAMDIVLFGPPKETGSLAKDLFIASLIAVIFFLLFKFNQMSRNNNSLLKKMENEMETLQEELLRFNQNKKVSIDASSRPSIVGKAEVVEPMDELGEENEIEPEIDDIEMDSVSQQVPWDNGPELTGYRDGSIDLDIGVQAELQLWLQLTYERERLVLENKIYEMKKQLEITREMCTKMKPSRTNLFGAFSFIHGRMEFKGQPVMEARTAFTEIQNMNNEMKYRWNSMENILGLPIVQNLGLEHLQFVLEPALQGSLPQPLNSTTAERAPESVASVSSLSRQSTTESLLRKSTHRDQYIRNDLVNNLAFPPGSVVGIQRVQRPASLVSQMKQSHTVGSGLSNASSEDTKSVVSQIRKSNTKMSERMQRFSKTGIKKVNANNGGFSSSTEEDQSGKFLVGESEIRIRQGQDLVSNRDGLNSPTQCPSVSHSLESWKGGSEDTKSLGKFSSEPSLDQEDGVSLISAKLDLTSKPKKGAGLLGKSKIFKFKSKTDKNKS